MIKGRRDDSSVMDSSSLITKSHKTTNHIKNIILHFFCENRSPHDFKKE